MAKEFELRKEIALDATPEQVWEAIATGPGITSWFSLAVVAAPDLQLSSGVDVVTQISV